MCAGWLSPVGRALAPAPAWEPAVARRTFRIATTDGMAALLLPDLVPRLAAAAPGVDLELLPLGARPFAESLAAGEVDLAISFFAKLPGALRRQRLLDERYACLARRDHPVVRGGLTRAALERHGHALVAPRGQAQSHLDAALARAGVRRRVAVVLPSFLLAPRVVAATDLLCVMNARLARRLAAEAGLAVLPLPVRLPAYPITQVWHERQHAEPGHRWLRQLVHQVGISIASM